MYKFLSSYLLFFFIGCANFGVLTVLTDLPKEFDENSGIVSISANSIWLVEDKGNADEIYQVDTKGKWLKTLKVTNAKNHDWEDLAKDKNNNVYIGDFGNNESRRKDLVIYKIPNPENEKGDKIAAEKIEFSYPEQTNFSPKKEELLYDAEAFFYWKEALFIITKNRATPFSGEAFIYKVPAQKGIYKAQLVGSFVTCADGDSCRVTAAAIAPDEKTIVLLGNGILWKFTDYTTDNFTEGTMETIDLGVRTQLEAVTFADNNSLYLSDEENKKTGRNLYSYRLK
tara:strand:- start:5278 stop:6129 length:852 start_codon:yes stop_codon:yes gene_type:complete